MIRETSNLACWDHEGAIAVPPRADDLRPQINARPLGFLG
jgi:hypothetical protein